MSSLPNFDNFATSIRLTKSFVMQAVLPTHKLCPAMTTAKQLRELKASLSCAISQIDDALEYANRNDNAIQSED